MKGRWLNVGLFTSLHSSPPSPSLLPCSPRRVAFPIFLFRSVPTLPSRPEMRIPRPHLPLLLLLSLLPALPLPALAQDLAGDRVALVDLCVSLYPYYWPMSARTVAACTSALGQACNSTWTSNVYIGCTAANGRVNAVYVPSRRLSTTWLVISRRRNEGSPGPPSQRAARRGERGRERELTVRESGSEEGGGRREASERGDQRRKQ